MQMKRNLSTAELIELAARHGRALPTNPEAEAALIGAMMYDGASPFTSRALALTINGEEPMFSVPTYADIARAMSRLIDEGNTIDPVSIATECGDRSGAVNDALIQIVGNAARTYNLRGGEFYLTAVRDTYQRRQLSVAIERASAMLLDYEFSLDDAREEVEQGIFEVSQDKTHGYKHVKNIAPEVLRWLDTPPLLLRGITSGIKPLDDLTNGWRKGNLIVIVAESSAGKTSLALSIAAHAASQTGVAINSAEMTEIEVTLRMVSNISKVNSYDISRGNLFQSQKEQVRAGISEIRKYNIFVDDQPDVSPMEIKGRLRKAVEKEGVGLAIVDYFQLMSAPGKFGTREQELNHIAQGLKRIAKEVNIPIILLAQVNDDSKSQKRKIHLRDIRECKALWMAADIGIAIIWDLPSDEWGEVIQGGLHVQKHRGGPTGTAKVEFDRTTSTYREMPIELSGVDQRFSGYQTEEAF